MDQAAATIGQAARFLPAGDTALVVEFGDAIDRRISARVMASARSVEAAAIAGVVELVPTFRSLMVHYDPLATSHERLVAALGGIVLPAHGEAAPARVWRIPVLYGGEGGPDLAEVARRAGLGESEAVALHAGPAYHVYMLGFLPGFAYLGDVPEPLQLPRLETPRLRVPPGSVAIARRMTAVYPVSSPGGWRLIGRTPVRFFDSGADRPTLLAPGDGVRFVPVGEAELAGIEQACAAGRYRVEREDGRS